ncbi:hypothetical protein COCVIDRAFT_113570 [Bipolaris victoriae FI3]|uniref:Uncharacterized protein n=1 Tax=Bipolaris victoriae (strain FI3) TaxID=930091 RepID=W7DU29_BIPV3|nr:hypothetical protein COCVIDRAFT_113570 [Bipolaris victoriae FI3]
MQSRFCSGDKGIWLVTAAAFQRAVSELEGIEASLKRYSSRRNGALKIWTRNEELKLFIMGLTNDGERLDTVEKYVSGLESLNLTADMWEDGRKAGADQSGLIYQIVRIFCWGCFRGELLAAAHYQIRESCCSGY